MACCRHPSGKSCFNEPTSARMPGVYSARFLCQGVRTVDPSHASQASQGLFSRSMTLSRTSLSPTICGMSTADVSLLGGVQAISLRKEFWAGVL